MKGILSLLALAVTACTNPPPFGSESSEGQVFAWSENDARHVLSLASAHSDRIAELLGVEPQPFVIWFERSELDRAGVRVWRDRSRRITKRRIEFQTDEEEAQLAFIIAHELVHWHVAGTVWDMVPLVIEEGMADYIALLLVPEWRAEREQLLRGRAREAQGVDWESLFAITKGEVDWSKEPDSRRRESTYMLGYAMVDRAGIDVLQELCYRARNAGLARVPSEWLLESAGMGSSAAEWDAALRSWGEGVGH